MFNKDNIKIFDYIFSTNFTINKENEMKYVQELRKKFDSIDDEYSFWMDLMYLVNRGSVFDATNIASGHQIGYTCFPKMTFETKNMYKEYKMNQIIDESNNQGNLNKTVIDKVCKNMCNKSIKKILDYCEENGYLKYLNEPYFWADDDIREIIYDNIELNIPKLDDISVHNEINVYGNNNDFSNSIINQSINYNEIDDGIIDTIKNLIPELELYKIDGEIVEKLKEYSNKNKKDKLINYLINTGANLSSSLIGYAINFILIKYGISIF